MVVATLWPFSFEFRSLTWAQYFEGIELAPSSFLDFPRNIVLFMPTHKGSRAPRTPARGSAVSLAGKPGLGGLAGAPYQCERPVYDRRDGNHIGSQANRAGSDRDYLEGCFPPKPYGRQAGDRLSVRCRSLLTGENGATPEVQFGGVIGSLAPQRLVITSDGITVRVRAWSSAYAEEVML